MRGFGCRQSHQRQLPTMHKDGYRRLCSAVRICSSFAWPKAGRRPTRRQGQRAVDCFSRYPALGFRQDALSTIFLTGDTIKEDRCPNMALQILLAVFFVATATCPALAERRLFIRYDHLELKTRARYACFRLPRSASSSPCRPVQPCRDIPGKGQQCRNTFSGL